ncbi:MAG: bifunctional 2-keto-4-hydroxyglutarate aldolase/2-keto-3-deoxy-6-phosphogluconate aldolase [Synergistaceae bacterium]|nr:bifunctional 2-keto-4-hydroxyglutarate aldolase/2-keto-3-deoxy-6-phosphogluconate aldolase [Synergistota bacterium]NLM71533.1 bifunctional 2-keto-4-hydroxyglutarate aldolase/2-keto-3-deoxy-6-phosphogluconate aldolase [Synergistaceae bacterium]
MNVQKHEVLQRLSDLGVVGIISARDMDDGVSTAEAVFEGGIDVLEFSTSCPYVFEIMYEVVERGRCKGLTLGAGAVSDASTARRCIDAGVDFIGSFFFDEDVARMCNSFGTAYIPGVGTISEIAKAMEWGVDLTRAFPGDVLGPKFIRAARTALPKARVMPLGGVAPVNLDDWFQAGAFAVGGGAGLLKPAGVEGDYQAIAKTAEHVVTQIALIRACLE